jgi:hypothetical protein
MFGIVPPFAVDLTTHPRFQTGCNACFSSSVLYIKMLFCSSFFIAASPTVAALLVLILLSLTYPLFGLCLFP